MLQCVYCLSAARPGLRAGMLHNPRVGFTAVCRPAPQERERLVLQAQQLQAQLSKQADEAREVNLRMAQLVAQLEEKTQGLEAAQVGALPAGCRPGLLPRAVPS